MMTKLSVGKSSCQRFDDHSNDLALDGLHRKRLCKGHRKLLLDVSLQLHDNCCVFPRANSVSLHILLSLILRK